MILWFLIAAPVVVSEVFRSPMMDLRIVAIAAVVPAIEVGLFFPLFLHTLAAPVSTLLVVMVLTGGRRLLRRRLLGIPIGLFLHIVLDGTWRFDQLILWPLLGWDLSMVELPEQRMSLITIVIFESAAVGLGVWATGRYKLNERENRQLFWRTGRLHRSVFH